MRIVIGRIVALLGLAVVITASHSFAQNSRRTTAESVPAIQLHDLGDLIESEFTTEAGETYRLTEEIGRGGQATFYDASRINPPCPANQDCLVAIAFKKQSFSGVESQMLQNPEFLDHPHINRPQARLAGTLSTSEDGLDGSRLIGSFYDLGDQNLATLIDLSIGEANQVFARPSQMNLERLQATQLLASQILSGIVEFDSAGYVHNDIKPGNILIAGLGEGTTAEDVIMGRRFAQLIDFGISRATEPGFRLEEPIGFHGTLYFAAPEAFETNAGEIYMRNLQTDLWSYGVTLYRMMFGRDLLKDFAPHLEIDPKSLSTRTGSIAHYDLNQKLKTPEGRIKFQTFLERKLDLYVESANARSEKRLAEELARALRKTLNPEPTFRQIPQFSLERAREMRRSHNIRSALASRFRVAGDARPNAKRVPSFPVHAFQCLINAIRGRN